MIVYHELLAEAYLLVLAADPAPGPTPEAELAAQLRYAARSDKRAVWVDCRLLPTLSRPAARLLWACHHRLRRRHARLVLCRVSAPLAEALAEVKSGLATELCQVLSLDEAVAQLHG